MPGRQSGNSCRQPARARPWPKAAYLQCHGIINDIISP
jgi:hypothetical protein